jgi:hypothetical protein
MTPPGGRKWIMPGCTPGPHRRLDITAKFKLRGLWWFSGVGFGEAPGRGRMPGRTEGAERGTPRHSAAYCSSEIGHCRERYRAFSRRSRGS